MPVVKLEAIFTLPPPPDTTHKTSMNSLPNQYQTIPNQTIPRFLGPKVQGFKGPKPKIKSQRVPKDQDISVTFKYELDSKEGPSCYNLNLLDFIIC